MIGKNTVARKNIEVIGDFYGVSYDDKTFKNISDILESYRQIYFNKDLFDVSVSGCEPLADMLPYVYRSFIKKEPIGSKCVNKLVKQMLNDEKTEDVLYDTLEAIKEFKTETPDRGKSKESDNDKAKEPIGMLYFEILHRLYFNEANPVHTDIYTDLGITSHVYSYRREEAIMLFCIYFWQRGLVLWKDWSVKEDAIKREEGRDDLLDF